MAIDSYGRPTYNDVIDGIHTEIDDAQIRSKLQTGVLKNWILEACQQITNKIPIGEQRTLILIKDQENYSFQDNTEPQTGTGTITTSGYTVTGSTSAGTGTITASGTTITGSSTLFVSELALGKAIVVGTEIKEVVEIHSNTECVIQSDFSATISASAFTISTTKFRRELAPGSIITCDSKTGTVDTITDAMTVTLIAPLTSNVGSATAFTIDLNLSTLPTRFHRIVYIDRPENTYHFPVGMVGLTNLLNSRKYDVTSSPWNATEWRDSSGRRQLKILPLPYDTMPVTVFAHIRILPSVYDSIALTAVIPLDQNYETMIAEYVLSKIQFVYAKNYNLSKLHDYNFRTLIGDAIRSTPNYNRMSVDYQ